jgi:hypothetical protein
MREFYLKPTAAGLAEVVARLKQGAATAHDARSKESTITRIQRTPSLKASP